MAEHRHQWTVLGFELVADRPSMRQSCTICGRERIVAAWDRSWVPPARWRLVMRAGVAAGRLLEIVDPELRAAVTGPGLESGAIKIDVWSDVACPWCYIGKRNLEAGVQAFRGSDGSLPVEVEYHSFELAPDTPVDFAGSELDYLARIKGISIADAQQMLDRVTGIAAEAGLRYDFASVRHTRTVKAHQLLHLAKADGLQAEMAERLFSAYFVEGRHIGLDPELADLGVEVGLDRGQVLDALREESHLADVRADQQRAIGYGIQGVPFYVIDGRYGLSGAQPSEVFASALRTAAHDRAVTVG